MVAAGALGLHTLALNQSGVNLVQSWVNGAADHGIIMANPNHSDSLTFRSRSATPPTTRPKLTVTYVVAR